MKRILLATVASMALAIPAGAQQQGQTAAPEQEQMLRGPAAEQQAGHEAPAGLNRDDIQRVQQALNERGVNAGEADGIWGPQTQAAVRQFQEQENIDASGQLNRETLSALGVQVAGMSEPSTTGSGVSEPSTTGSGEFSSDPGAVSPGADEDADRPDMDGQSR